MAGLDSCINDLFEPGNTATDSGTYTTPHYSGYLLARVTESGSVTGESRFTPSFEVSSTRALYVTITGTWSGQIVVSTEGERDIRGVAFTSNVTEALIPIIPGATSTFAQGFPAPITGTANVTFFMARRIGIIGPFVLPFGGLTETGVFPSTMLAGFIKTRT